MTVLVGLVAIGIVILALSLDWGPSAGSTAGLTPLFRRCLAWGVGIGGATGGLTGVSMVLSAIGREGAAVVALVVPGALYGAVIGALVAVVPSLLGAFVVTRLVARRHPVPAPHDLVEAQLGAIFRVVVAVLDLALVVVLVADGGLAALGRALPFAVAGNACVVLMLCRSRAPLARSWSPPPSGGSGGMVGP